MSIIEGECGKTATLVSSNSEYNLILCYSIRRARKNADRLYKNRKGSFDRVEYIDGIPTISLRGLIMMKQSLGREKDLADIAAIKEFVRRQNKD